MASIGSLPGRHAQAQAPLPQAAASLPQFHTSTADRTRSKSREHRSPSRSIALAPADMGVKVSKPVLKVGTSTVAASQQPPPDSATSTNPTPSTPLQTVYGSNRQSALHSATTDNSSICRSPTWSPRGSLATRTQAGRDRRDKERELRKEAEEAKKRLKEFKDSSRRKPDPTQPSSSVSTSATTAEASQTSRLQKRTGRRLSKQPPPAAMQTQRMPAALRADQSQTEMPASEEQAEPKRRRRSSSLSGMLRLVTGRSNSTSRSRPSSGRNSITDDEQPYMSDASTKSRSSFIGGVKLRQQQKEGSEVPRPAEPKSPRIESSMRSTNGSFTTDLQAQFDEISGRSTGGTKPLPEQPIRGTDSTPTVSDRTSSRGKTEEAAAQEVNANMGRRRSTKLDAESKPLPQPPAKTQSPTKAEDGKRRQSISEQFRSSREASLNRMQNLVTPLRSAMKGGREVAKGGKTQSMPGFANPKQSRAGSKDEPSQTNSNVNYVHRARLRSQSRSLAGWHDEMAVKEANELASAQAVAEAQSRPSAADATQTTKYGPHMPPTPDRSINDSTTPRASHDTAVKAAEIPVDPRPGPHHLLAPGITERVIWRQPIKANKVAAAERVEQADDEKPRISTDVDKLPSQNRTRYMPDSDDMQPAGARLREANTNAPTLPSPTSPLPSDDENRGLRRQPAVMSWKAEKQSSKSRFSPEPLKSSTLPSIASNTASKAPHGQPPRPEDHPSLAGLRSQPPEAESSQLTVEDPIFRPFSIVPTPVASPSPNVKTSESPNSAKPITVARKSSKAKKAASKAIDAMKERQAGPRHREIEHKDNDRSRIAPAPVPSPVPSRRHSTPPVEMTGGSKGALNPNTVTFPFPDRHEPLLKPSSRPPNDRQTSSTSKVTFHTPPESPRFLSIPTSYDSYRRAANDQNSSGLSTSDIDDDIQLPVPVSQLGKPNPPFAREGRKTPSPNRTPRGGTSPQIQTGGTRIGNPPDDAKSGYVYVDFSPAGSSSTVNLSDSSAANSLRHSRKMSKGFVIKNADGVAMDPVAKLFVICCSCRKWHDIPSNLYREMAKGLRKAEPNEKAIESGIAEAKAGKQTRKSGIISTVQCCWCNHEMSVMCCEGWSTLCYMSAQYHSGLSQEGGGAITGTKTLPTKATRE